MKHQDRELNGSYTVAQRLLPRHYEIQDLTLKGYNGADIARKTGISYRQVMNLLNTPSFQHTLALRRDVIESSVDEEVTKSHDEVTQIIKKQTIAAVNRLVDLIDSDNPSVARQASNDILDRGGFPKVSKTDNTHHSSFLIDDTLAARLEEALAEIQTPSPSVSSPDTQNTPPTQNTPESESGEVSS